MSRLLLTTELSSAATSSQECGNPAASSGPGDGPSHPVHTAGMLCPGEAASSSRADKFLARVDRDLPAMSAPEQRKFLDRLIETWEGRYGAFVRSDGKSEYCADPLNPISAADFTLTITGLAARREALERAS